jgi:hypothetical protein
MVQMLVAKFAALYHRELQYSPLNFKLLVMQENPYSLLSKVQYGK